MSYPRYLAWLPALGWAGIIFRLSAVPGSSIPGRFGWQAHFIEYALLAALAHYALRSEEITDRLLTAVAIASAYGVTDELHQAWVVLRTSDPLDWAVDTAGAAVAVGLLAMISRLRRSPTQ